MSQRPVSEENLDAPIIIEEHNSKGEIVAKYMKGRFLGKGGFAKCYEFTTVDTKQVYAAKIVSKASLTKNRTKQKLMSEIKIHRSLHHPNIVHLEHFFEDSENVYILLEICRNNTTNELLKRRKRLTEIEVRCYMAQILSAIKYLHKHRVIHRDLKLGNIFLSEKMEVKLGDFGLAAKLEYDGEKKRTICGTPNYIAPEILDGKTGHSYEVDVWSLGVILYTFLIGRPPYETTDVKTTYKKIKMNSYSFPENVTISTQAKNLITKILVLDPSKRPTLDEITNHEFFTMVDSIPKLLPASTLACPPSSSYMRQYMPHNREAEPQDYRSVSPKRLDTVEPMLTGPKLSLNERKDFINTDRYAKCSNSGNSFTPTANVNNINIAKVENLQLGKVSQSDKPGTQSTKNMFNLNVVENQPRSTKDELPISTKKALDHHEDKFFHTNGFRLKASPIKGASSTKNLGITANHTYLAGTEVWIKRWVDYSSKYGLGYLLSNGCAGVLFNDSTKIVMNAKGSKFIYVEKKGADRQDIILEYNLTDYPQDLKKKVTLLHHFKGYLEEEEAKNKDEPKRESIETTNDLNGIFPVYVKKWMKTKHATMFRLSSKVVQVIFQDHTQIILSSELKIITYVNKKHERLHYPLSTALQSSNQEMTKRLKYTKDILTHMLGGGNLIPGIEDENKKPATPSGSTRNGRSSSSMPKNDILNLHDGNQTTKRADSLTSRAEGKDNLRLSTQMGRSSYNNVGSNVLIEKGA